MAKRDLYDVLGVAKNATDDDLKKAYRKAAGKFHPDRHSGDAAKKAEENFKEAKEAYEILSDKGKRSDYDNFGHKGSDGRFEGHAPGSTASKRTSTPEVNPEEALGKLLMENPKTMLASAITVAGLGGYMSYKAHKNRKSDETETKDERHTRILQNVVGLGLLGSGLHTAYQVGAVPDAKGNTWAKKIFAKAEESASHAR